MNPEENVCSRSCSKTTVKTMKETEALEAENAQQKQAEKPDKTADAQQSDRGSEKEIDARAAKEAEKKGHEETEKENTGPSATKENTKRKKHPERVRKRKKLTLAQRARRLLIRVGVIAAVIWVLVTKVGGVFICHTSDMYPALRDGDLVITFRLGTYRSGDIVAYDLEGKTGFGRIVGEPGDEIYIDEEGNYTVNGSRPYETIFYETRARESDRMRYPYTIRDGEYFVLAEAREEGIDSRSLGPITKLKGKIVLLLRRRGF